MGKLASYAPSPVRGAVRTVSASPDAVTYEGGQGYSRDPKSELFLLAAVNMVGEDTFYEGASERDSRFRGLIAQVTKSDPGWIARFVPYLRNSMNMRSASIVMAVEYVIAGGPNGRTVIDAAISRADEPAEVLGYYRSRVGRAIPKPIKRGVADAARRLYNERSSIKYDTSSSAYRFGDVIDIVHPEPKAPWQSALFRYSLDKRHDRDNGVEGLPVIAKYRSMLAMPAAERRSLILSPQATTELSEAGMTWENVSGWLQGPMDAKAWEAIIPSMGYMALLRNLRNFEEAKVSDETRRFVAAKLSDPEEVAKSRQLLFRFWSAMDNIQSYEFKAAVEKAMQHALKNVPVLRGRSLVLIDSSGSMGSPMSMKSKITFAQAGAVLGSALALSGEAEIHNFADRADTAIEFTKATPVLEIVRRVVERNGRVGYGTQTGDAIQQTYNGHDRIIIVTDEQAWAGRAVRSPKAGIPIYNFNLGGYRYGHTPSGGGENGKSYTFGGLTDASFKMLDMIERGRNADWPF